MSISDLMRQYQNFGNFSAMPTAQGDQQTPLSASTSIPAFGGLGGDTTYFPTGFTQSGMPTDIMQPNPASPTGKTTNPADNTGPLGTYPISAPIAGGVMFPGGSPPGTGPVGTPSNPFPTGTVNTTAGAFDQFGLPTGQIPGGNALGFMQSQNIPTPQYVQDVANGLPTQSPDVASQAMAIGQSNIPSMQTLANLSPSAQSFLQGFFETVLGIPWEDVLYAAQKPFLGLRGGNPARMATPTPRGGFAG